MTKKIALSAVHTIGMALLGAVTGLLAPMVPAAAGLAVGLAGAAVVTLGQAGAAVSLLGYGAGLSAAVLLFQPGWIGLGIWYAAFLMLAHILTQVQLRQKLPLPQVMIQTAAWLFMAGMASYVALYYLKGDGVAFLVETLKAELAAVEEVSTEVYDMMLSLLSANGYLPDVGLESFVWELDEQTRRVLTAAMVDLFDESLRLSVMDILVRQAMHIALIAPLMTLMSYARKGESERVTKLPDLAQMMVPRKASTVLFIMVIICMVLMLFVESAAPVYIAGMTVFEFVYGVQGLSVGEWFLRRKGMNRGLRRLILWAGFILLPGVMFFLGFIEHIFRFRKMQELKDSGMLDQLRRAREEELEQRIKEFEELTKHRDDDDDHDGRM